MMRCCSAKHLRNDMNCRTKYAVLWCWCCNFAKSVVYSRVTSVHTPRLLKLNFLELLFLDFLQSRCHSRPKQSYSWMGKEIVCLSKQLLFASNDRSWLSVITVRMWPLMIERSYECMFITLLDHYHVVTTWWILCTGKPSGYITNTKINSAFHPSSICKLSTSQCGWG